MEFKIVKYNSPEYLDMLALRAKILREPLGLTFSEDDLHAEVRDTFCICSVNSKIIACCILTKLDEVTAKLRQMAVDKNHQGNNIGELMLKFAEETALNSGYNTISLHARKEAIGFYLKYGYNTYGSYFTEVGIPHLKMEKNITIE